MQSRLAIAYGAATVRAVLVAPGGALRLDGDGEASTAAHVSAAGVVVGAAAWRQAMTDPDGLVVSPLRAGAGRITVAGVEVEVVDLVAASLKQVVAETQQVAGGPVEDVRLVVPAGWGPRRRTWLRHAARTAGLNVTQLVEAPVAALNTVADTDMSVRRPVMVLDIGAGGEVSVVQPGPAGPEVLSTLADPDAGGDRIDAALVRTLTGTDLEDVPGADRWVVLANVRAARHALSEQVAVTMPMPGGRPPMVVGAAQVGEAARPVFDRVAELALQAVDNADLTLTQLGGVHLIGGAAVTPGAAELIAAKLGAPVLPVAVAGAAAVLGAAEAGTVPAADVGADELRLPPWRRLFTLALPGTLSLVLYAHFVVSAEFNNGTPTRPRYGYYVTANWGELPVAAALALITFLQAAALLAALLGQDTPTGQRPRGSRVSGGIAIAVAAGLAVACMYAVAAAVLFAQPISELMRWSVLPILPAGAAASVVAVLAWWRRTAPTHGWDSLLTFPATAMLLATAGIVAISLWWDGDLSAQFAGQAAAIGLGGGLLVGIALAVTVAPQRIIRLLLAVPLGLFVAVLSRTGPALPGIIWALAVGCWWAWPAWALVRTPPTNLARR